MLNLDEIIKFALEEDRAFNDVTTSFLVPEDVEGKAFAYAKSNGVMAGGWVAEKVFLTVDPELKFKILKADSEEFRKGDRLFEVEGRLASILKAERTALNFIQRMCGIATMTRKFVERVKGTGARIMDTRKTTPLLRLLEKYAVKAGGGENHRFDLEEMVIIKENHIKAVGSFREAIKRAKASKKFIEVEVTNLEELKIALEEKVDRVMLDNFSLQDIKKAVEIAKGRVELEASGGVTLDNVREIALTGVDMISVGALTHSFKSADISLLVEEVYE